jgi:hypothetical protein
MTISRDIWQRLRAAGIIDTYDKDLRNYQLKKAGPYKLMSIRGIGPRVAHILLSNASWKMPLAELEHIYDKLENRTKYESVKKIEKHAFVKQEHPAEKAEPQEDRARRYIALLLKTPAYFAEIFELVAKSNGIPYDGRIPHKILHLTIDPPQESLFKDVLARFDALTDLALPGLFRLRELHKFPDNSKIIFLGDLDTASKIVHTPHMTFGEFKTDAQCSKFLARNADFLKNYQGKILDIEALAIIKKDYGIEYAIPILAMQKETYAFLPRHLKVFLDFLGHKHPIKYQVFLPYKDGKRQGSGRNTYAQNADEVINLAKMDNGKGIICVAVSEHGQKQTEDITNITKLLTLVVDVDVKKQRKINYVSSRADHLHAISIAYTLVKKELEAMGFEVGLITDSGNGSHVYVKVSIDIPEDLTQKTWPDSEVCRKISAIEQKLREKVHDDIVDIDFITKDVVRRIKVPGTLNIKDTSQAEDRMCRIIYQADDSAEEKNNEAFAKIIPIASAGAPAVKQSSGKPVAESEAVVPDAKVADIIGSDKKLKLLYNGKIIYHGEDKKIEMKGDKIYAKSRSEAEHALVSGLIRKGIRNFEQMDKIMTGCKIGKWQEDSRGSYRKKTFDKALSFTRTTAIPEKPASDLDRLLQKIKKIKI